MKRVKKKDKMKTTKMRIAMIMKKSRKILRIHLRFITVLLIQFKKRLKNSRK